MFSLSLFIFIFICCKKIQDIFNYTVSLVAKGHKAN